MALSRKTDETPKHVTPLRIGERVVELILSCGKVVGLRRGKGRRFSVLVETEQPIKSKGRKRQ